MPLVLRSEERVRYKALQTLDGISAVRYAGFNLNG